MVLSGCAKLVGIRSGNKNNKRWCSLVLDALDNPLERVEYFVPDDLIGVVDRLPLGDVCVTVRLYPGKDHTFGSRLLNVGLPESVKK